MAYDEFNPIHAFKTDWITYKIDETGINYLDEFGLFLCDKKAEADRTGNNAITTSQLRNVFGEIKRIEMKAGDSEDVWEKDCKQSFLLLRPKIAYNAARVLSKSRNSKMKELKQVLDMAHKQVKTLSSFKNFSHFFEAILAYHKAYGGRD
ncbi:MAG: type III-A CRISPR-associated protein Csm2 [Thalassobius sp.]|nr:type III-A CRISPR-associated protein Csm2 [Thalassovita sp.]